MTEPEYDPAANSGGDFEPESGDPGAASDDATSAAESVTVERVPAADAFGVLASDARIEILRALGSPPREPRAFSALFDAVSIEDSGNFTYHLEELRDTFVRKTDERYRLTDAGERVVGSILAGTYTADASVPPTTIGSDCQLCGGSLVFEYADERARVICEACDQGRSFPFPPGVLAEHDLADLPAVSARWYRTRVLQLLDGFCPVCGGAMDGRLVRGAQGGEPPRPSLAAFECERCGTDATLSGATIATFHPVVEGFLFEHGFDTRAGPHSDVWAGLDDSTVTVRRSRSQSRCGSRTAVNGSSQSSARTRASPTSPAIRSTRKTDANGYPTDVRPLSSEVPRPSALSARNPSDRV